MTPAFCMTSMFCGRVAPSATACTNDTRAFWYTSKLDFSRKWLLRMFLWSLPLPWVAIELGWFVAEYGRQPWAIDGVLPTFLATSTLTRTQLWITLIGFTVLYGGLAVIEVRLMLAAIRHGPYDPVGDPAGDRAECGPGQGVDAAGHGGQRVSAGHLRHHHAPPPAAPTHAPPPTQKPPPGTGAATEREGGHGGQLRGAAPGAAQVPPQRHTR